MHTDEAKVGRRNLDRISREATSHHRYADVEALNQIGEHHTIEKYCVDTGPHYI